ncbi:TetR family transcriptional regulator C-terminal domain-containing protein [Primorskyibacter marinus]|uniref:TetR family transcriptional regulator C-terminal domain-containing protein n=1 Tax=Primorskyibacter marinus TaxID=1977320 RepID=UPI000E30204F|nr:TetR family transcriptional regulator C-terminal domain-containing protein [Primorskyibacter marinus]
MDDGKPPPEAPKRSRIQKRNRKRILDAALNVFSQHGYRGATLDQIATEAGLSKPNILYYFDGKAAIHVDLLNTLMAEWLAPLQEMDPEGEPLDELMRYISRKLAMSHAYPRESRLFANEIIQGAPRMGPHLASGLKTLFDEKCALIASWVQRGKLAPVDPGHLIFSIWAVTQHYADFEAQVEVLMPRKAETRAGAEAHVEALFRKLLTPPGYSVRTP